MDHKNGTGVNVKVLQVDIVSKEVELTFLLAGYTLTHSTQQTNDQGVLTYAYKTFSDANNNKLNTIIFIDRIVLITLDGQTLTGKPVDLTDMIIKAEKLNEPYRK